MNLRRGSERPTVGKARQVGALYGGREPSLTGLKTLGFEAFMLKDVEVKRTRGEGRKGEAFILGRWEGET